MASSCLRPQWQRAFCCSISSVWAKAIWLGRHQVPGEGSLEGCLDVIPFSLKQIFLSFSSAIDICSLSVTSQVALAPKSRSSKDHDQRECLALSADHLPRKMPQWACSLFHFQCPEFYIIFHSSLWCRLQESVFVIRFKYPGQRHTSPAHLTAGKAVAESFLYLMFSFQLMSSSFQ